MLTAVHATKADTPDTATAQDPAAEREAAWRQERELEEQAEAAFEQMLRNEKWAVGKVPDSLLHHVPFVSAVAFLHAADMIGKLLARIEAEPTLPSQCKPAIQSARKAFAASFPTLKDTRDSIQHYEERVRGRAKPQGKKKAEPIQLQPVPSGNPIYSSGMTPLVVGSLVGNVYQTTLGDGSLGAVEISVQSITSLRDLLQDFFNSLPHDGPPSWRIVPA